MPLSASDARKLVTTSSQSVEVSQADVWVHNKDLAIQYNLSTQSVFAGEMLTLNYRLETNDAFISLRIENEIKKGEEYIVLRTRKQELPRTADRRYRYELKVLYNNTRSGDYSFKVPVLVYSEGGRDTYRFHFANQRIQVKALPPYLPPYIALQDTQIISSMSEHSSWYDPLDTGRVYFWNITLKAKNASLQAMPEITQQISSNLNIDFLPAEITRQTEKHHDTVIQQVQYSIPFTLKKNGYFSMPAIRLQYFDSLQRRLISRQYIEDKMLSLNRYIQWLIMIGVLLLAAYLLKIISVPCFHVYQQLRILYQGRKQLRKAETAQQVHQAMKLFGKSLGWPENIGLKQWSQKWNACMGADNSLDEDIRLLGRKLYSLHQDEGELFIQQNILRSSCVQQGWQCIRSVIG